MTTPGLPDHLDHTVTGWGRKAASVPLERSGEHVSLDGEWVAASDARAPMQLGPWLVLPGATPGEGVMVSIGTPERRAQPEKVDAINGFTAQP